MAKRRKYPVHVKKVRAKGEDYWYFDTGTKDAKGKTIYNRLPDISDPKFGDAYAGMLAGRTRRKNAAPIFTVSRLISLYENSQKFKKLKPNTQKTYTHSLREIERLIGNAPIGDVTQADVARIMDEKHEKPGAANLLLSVIGAIYKWGRTRHYTTADPAKDIEPFELGSHHPWPDHILEAGLRSKHDRTRLAVHLLYYTAQRIGDVCKMRWTDIQDGYLTVTQEKTDVPLTIKLHSNLVAELAKHPKRAMTIICSHDGRPMGSQVIRKELKLLAKTFGSDCVPHGLRKNAVIALLEVGCTVAETAAVSGQSFAMVEYYAKMRNQKRLGSAAILKWEGTHGE